MTGIGGPGGVGPKGPPGVDPAGAQGPSDGAGAVQTTRGGEQAAASGETTQAQRTSAAAGLQSMDALAQEIAAGRLTPNQAIDYLVDAAGAQLDAAERIEFREMLSDLFANDPHLSGLIANLTGRQ